MSQLANFEAFSRRHLGPNAKQQKQMLQFLGLENLGQLIDQAVPSRILMNRALTLADAKTEVQALEDLRSVAQKNRIFKSYLGMGYSDCITPSVIQRNILENPGWYTQYTPYQAEIAQGRLEALLNFQTMVMDLTGMEITNASLLDEGTAAAEAMYLCRALKGSEANAAFFVSDQCHPQTIAVVQTRAKPLGVKVIVGDAAKFDFSTPVFGCLVQYPNTSGSIESYAELTKRCHDAGALMVVSADILSLTLLTPPGEWGADVVVGSTQRLGVPMGFGGPHAAYFATKDAHKRLMPGRLVGVSKDVDGKSAIRLALQTREQHIRRDKATSNICTAQVLLAIMASMYAVYHGPEGLKFIAQKIHRLTAALAGELKLLGFEVMNPTYFDSLKVKHSKANASELLAFAEKNEMNLRAFADGSIGISIDEATTEADLLKLLQVLAGAVGAVAPKQFDSSKVAENAAIPEAARRTSAFLTHPVFNTHHSETEMLRYIFKLQNKDLSLAHSMIPLGSCTMKLNATTEMLPVTWAEFSKLHPFAPESQTAGYREMLTQLEADLSEVTGFAGVSLQPNAGSQGEYTGLLVIRAYQESLGQSHRDVCLIPKSAHGTNPASATLAGMKVVVVDCDSQGNVDLADLRAKAKEHEANLSALMVTYPSTHGVFEETIQEVCDVVHQHGGQVYMDGANMNAQVGICRPGDFGPDVCHLNLHKTFCIPHGGGGPGMGPIGVAKHLKPFLPGHPVVKTGGEKAIGPVSAAPWGSASILPISYLYIRMMGAEGLRQATEIAILNANYIAKRLAPHFPILYRGKNNWVAHECIFDLRPIKDSAGVEVEDVAKRLMDYGFHAPTVSFPVGGTIMVEPTESESLPELDRFCDAMISIRKEIAEIESGKMDRQNNPLKNAPHTADQVTRTEWSRSYSREQAVYPLPYVRENKFWPSVGRINNVLGDRNLICGCLPIESYQS